MTPVFLQALNDGQHPLAGTGAGVPSGQVSKTMVHKVAAQLGLNAVRSQRKETVQSFRKVSACRSTYAVKDQRQCQSREVSR